MARTAENVRTLIKEDPAMAEAIVNVLEASEHGEESLQWTDVREDLTSGQWGRLIEKGILTDAEDGFAISDPDAVEAALDGDEAESSDIETTSWTKWDKAAAGASIALFAGYSLPSIRNVVGGTVDLVFGPLDVLLPFYVMVLILAVITGLYSSLLQANLMDMEKMGQYQQQMKDIQDRRKAAKERGDDAALERIQEEQMEAMGDQMGMFKEQFRPMVWIMLITIPLFLWMYWKILGGHLGSGETSMVMPIVGTVEWTTGVLGPIQAWILWYFLCSMGFSQIVRKSLNIDMTPG